MLYPLHDLSRRWLEPISALAKAGAALFQPFGPNLASANLALLHRVTRSYGKPALGISTVTAHGREVEVSETVIATRPFCRLVRLARRSEDAATAAQLASDPRVLVCAPLSGHHASLLRETMVALLADHDVYFTDWIDAREVPVGDGVFHLADYVAYIQDFISMLGAETLHVVSVCQPTVPVLGAIALAAAAGEPTPRSMTLMGGPIDARRSPTAVNRFAVEHPYAFFEANMIHHVPGGHPGAGRAVYPGFLQLSAFVMMNPIRHLGAYRDYWFDHLHDASGGDRARSHERFYDEYCAVLDMDAAYYLDTVRDVFQNFALATGTWHVGAQHVQPEAISTTALFTIEGALDDISGLGQTEAAHGLCSGIAPEHKRHLVAADCGHYGIFSGRRWRESIYPELRGFIRSHH